MDEDWYIDVTVIRHGKRNERGDVTDKVRHVISGVLFDPGSSVNEPDRMEIPDDQAKLFIEGNPSADIRNEDRVEFTAYGVDYKFGVAGHPLRFPQGCEVRLGE